MDRIAALPSLFDEYDNDPAPLPPDSAPVEKTKAQLFKKMITDVLVIRRELAPELEEYRPMFDCFLEDLRSLTRISESQLEEQILYSIEKQGATTITEISEDLRMSAEKIKNAVEEMMDRGDLYKVKKYIPGSDRAWYMIKSRRQNIPEADEVFEKPATPAQMFERLTYESKLTYEEPEVPAKPKQENEAAAPAVQEPKPNPWRNFQVSKRSRRRARHAMA